MYYKKVALVIPAYNESYTISDVISSLQYVLAKTKLQYQIIVIDDGSTDDTAILAEKAGAHVIRHVFNTGVGGAVATGMRFVRNGKYDLAVTLDADNQHDANDVLNVIEYAIKSGDDLVIGSRLIDTTGMPFLKIIGNYGLGFITFCLFGLKVRDSQSGLRIFSKQAIKKLHWKIDGHGYCSEILWRAKQQKLAVSEHPIRAIYTDYSKSKGQNSWNGFRIIHSLLKWRLVELFGE